MSLRQFFINQTWWGKIIGAFLGYLMGGPLGALFGILIGNFFDRGLNEHFSRPYWHYHAEKRKKVQKIFFEATFSVMGHIAKTDGRVSEQEIRMARGLMEEMRLNAEQKRTAISLFNEGKSTNFNFKRILTLLKETSHDNLDLLKLFIDIQYRAAKIDGLTDKKIQTINTILQYLGFAPLEQQYRFYEDFQFHSTHRNHSRQQSSQRQSSSSSYTSYTPPNSSLAHAYAILEINPDSSKHDVKKAYRRLMSRNHPDKLIAQGLPEEMIKLATDKTQKIRQAYEQICASKGWE
ncbi:MULTISPECIES: co-chaperone DjlA [Legionella]|uniref:Co-chaperone protein DjlA n=1 Tax=Legionella septentrionalis TaxID=2498109 RepID=A0A3S0XHN9_9GAMM|nr:MULTISPECIES: co-chaperone DjlA [Legionella]MCP0914079.1 co-chaperone DjlA [Legionella sp. 27cVA30]RUQ90761.1 co-chaperone DjlA [Legionella septentrionalis]RUQ99934.1 co-chaperone DjlA [Legionella septentrionalis]RUR10222.1 co-chaperone DjlA [Legionella septentrionalis]RUR15766.1 co-chaperone DjlA [Legionella septentrionalis]